MTAALEPGILEETERYLNIIILLAGFNRFPKWRVPIAVYGSALLFGLPHLSNLGIYGETLPATLAQAIGVTGDGFLWAVLYLYSGKIWPSMLAHFM
ncbi:CPBP family intramembrane metalloprotease, partial [Lactobacillus sp. XV13L]|nr:CPBP family intramembrane metalloprotease [Lactobacillus sp. XV13L]